MEVLAVFAAVAVFLCPLACILFYKRGIDDGRNGKEGKQIAPVVKAKPKPMTDEEKEKSQRLSNWLGWNGDKQ